MQEKIFCKQCGTLVKTSENFCGNCGEQINSDSINSISDESTQIPVEDIIPDQGNKSFEKNNNLLFKPANRMKRLFARLLDVVFGVIAALIPGFVLTFLSGGSFDPERFFLGAVVGIISFVIYQWYLLATTSQTIGKKYLKIKIVKLVKISGEYKTFEESGFFVNVVLREWVMTLIGIFPAIGGIIQIVDVLFIFRDDRRCIHDLIAGTAVIKVIE